MKLRKCQRVSLIAFALALAAGSPSASRAQENQDLMPRLGETTAEFEARTRGLSRPASPAAPSSVTLVADARGHFFVEPIINGSPVRMMVDTGATVVALSEKDARQAGIRPSPSEFNRQTSTANGVVLVAPVILREISIGEITMRNVPAIVIPESKLPLSLLGMSFLSKLSHFEVRAGRLVLKR